MIGYGAQTKPKQAGLQRNKTPSEINIFVVFVPTLFNEFVSDYRATYDDYNGDYNSDYSNNYSNDYTQNVNSIPDSQPKQNSFSQEDIAFMKQKFEEKLKKDFPKRKEQCCNEFL